VSKRFVAGIGGIRQSTDRFGCLDTSTSAPPCRRLGPVDAPGSLVVAPDGRHAYLASAGSDTVDVYSRNRRTGKLAHAQCVAAGVVPGCTVGRALDDPTSVAIAPNGDDLFVAARASGSIAHFKVDSTGLLRQPPGSGGCVNETGADGCRVARHLEGADDVVVAPDGTAAYAAAGNALLSFEIASNGSLTQLDGSAGCITHVDVADCATWPLLTLVSSVEMAGNDGVLAASRVDDALSSFPRDVASGVLSTPLAGQCIDAQGDAGCRQSNGVLDPTGLAATMRHAYVASEADRVTSVRVSNSGALRAQGCVDDDAGDPCRQVRAIGAPSGVAAIGAHVYVTSQRDSAVTGYQQGASSLIPMPGRRGCLVDSTDPPITDCADGRALRRLSAITASPDGTSVYAVSATEDSVAVLDRDSSAPSCDDRSVTTDRNEAVRIRLRCRDADHDVLRLGIVDEPSHGTLGRIDQRTDRVRFVPARGFTGTARLTYRATARGVQSPPAMVRIDVGR
jgi:DNA-binding beta-propeller fold protein YncE